MGNSLAGITSIYPYGYIDVNLSIKTTFILNAINSIIHDCTTKKSFYITFFSAKAN